MKRREWLKLVAAIPFVGHLKEYPLLDSEIYEKKFAEYEHSLMLALLEEKGRITFDPGTPVCYDKENDTWRRAKA